MIYVRCLAQVVDQQGAATPAGQSRFGPPTQGSRQQNSTHAWLVSLSALSLSRARGSPIGYFPLGSTIVITRDYNVQYARIDKEFDTLPGHTPRLYNLNYKLSCPFPIRPVRPVNCSGLVPPLGSPRSLVSHVGVCVCMSLSLFLSSRSVTPAQVPKASLVSPSVAPPPLLPSYPTSLISPTPSRPCPPV